MKRILLTIGYDGRGYYGWQKQNGVKTIQGELEEAFFKATGEKIEVHGSGRTDAGVHAYAQTAHFDMQAPIPIEKIKDILNGALPPDIAVAKVEEVAPNFHARFDIKQKTYAYFILNTTRKCPFDAYRYGFVKKELDASKMQEAADLLVGTHDFRGFCCAQTSATDFVRTIFKIKVIRLNQEMINVEVSGSGFLYNMVRIIVGTLVDYSHGKLTLEQIKDALENGKRACAGQTMPASGLYLLKTQY